MVFERFFRRRSGINLTSDLIYILLAILGVVLAGVVIYNMVTSRFGGG